MFIELIRANYGSRLQTCDEVTEGNSFKRTKVKVKLFLYLTKHHAMKAYWGVEV
jgi:hypothetical protein